MANLSSFYPQPVVAGTTEGTFTEGNDERVVGALQSDELGDGEVTASGASTARELSNRFADAVNVKDFGAVGDGVADDAPAFRDAAQIAYDTGKTVYFPTGTYRLATLTTGATSLPSGSGRIIDLINNNSTPKQFAVIGDQAVLTTPLYPQQYTSFGDEFTMIRLLGNFSRVHFEGLKFICTQPLHTANSAGGTPVAGATGRTYGVYLGGGEGGLFWSTSIRPKNVTFLNCSFTDFVIGCRADNAENMIFEGCQFFYTKGKASVGDPDWSVGVGSRQVKGFSMTNCFFDGCTSNSLEDVSPYPQLSSADGMVVCFRGPAHATEGVRLTNNYIKNFGFEGIYVLGFRESNVSPPTLTQNRISIGPVISNNVLDGRQPVGTAPTRTNWGIRSDHQQSIISNNTIYEANAAISISGTLTLSPSDPSLGAAAHFSIVKNNIITAPKSGRNGSKSFTGIGVAFAEGTIIEDNLILGDNIAANRQNGWDGVGVRPTATVASSSVANNTITVTGNVWPNGSTVIFSGLPAGSGLTAGTTYFVIDRAGDIFKVSISETGSAVDITADITGATITAGNLDIPKAIAVGGGTLNFKGKTYVRRNVFRIVSKATSGVLSVFMLVDGQGVVYCEDNYSENSDFFVYRFGGGDIYTYARGNRFVNGKRLFSGYLADGYENIWFSHHSLSWIPQQSGWHELKFLGGSRRNSAGKITISISPETAAGDPVIGGIAGNQNTQFAFSQFSNDLTTNARLSLSQIYHAGGTNPMVDKVYLTQTTNGNVRLYIHVPRITTKVRLQFSGGGGSGASANAVLVDGSLDSIADLVGGSGYTSAPSVFVEQSWALGGSGASLTATISGNSVDNITINNGGSGYNVPVNLTFEADQNNEVPLVGGFYDVRPVSAPTGGIEMKLSAGSKNIARLGNGLPVFGSGDPIVATQAPTESPEVTPEFIGQQYINTASGIAYIATGTSSSSDWKALATWNP